VNEGVFAMSVRDGLRTAVRSGGATAAKLTVAALAFAAVYGGAGTVHPTGEASAPARAATDGATGEATRGATGGAKESAPQSAKVRLVTAQARPPVRSTADETRPEPGKITVSAVPVGAGRAGGGSSGGAADSACRRAYRAQALVPAADGVAVYHWRLQRWSETSRTWRPYLSAPAGFTDTTRPVRWRPPIVANPGWYRVEIRIQPGGTYLSEGFEVTC